MKKLMVLLVAFVALFVLSACGGEYGATPPTNEYPVIHLPATPRPPAATEAEAVAAWAAFEEHHRHFTHVTSVQQEVDEIALHAEFLTGFLGIPIAPGDFAVDAHYFDWLDFITEEQLGIVKDYLAIPPGGFDDDIIRQYAMGMVSEGTLTQYDQTPMEEMPGNPRRIITRMFEAEALVNINLRYETHQKNPHEFADFSRFVRGLNREVFDWR
jgi:hypothetical protein